MKPQRRRFTLALTILLAAAILLAPVAMNRETKDLDDATRADLPGQFVRLPDGVTHYEWSGPEDGPVVVLVNGFSAPYFTWDPTLGALHDAGLRVLRYDLFGRGFSDRPEVTYDVPLFVRQLNDLLDALHVDGPVHVAGLSFGGLVAASFSASHPERVRSLTLIDPQAANVTAESIFPLATPLLGEYLMDVYIGPVRLPQTQGSDFYRPERFPDYTAQYRAQMQYRGFKRAVLSTLRSLVGVDPMAAYARVSAAGIPTLLIWGEQDQTVTAPEIQQVRAALPGAEFHAIPEAGHLAHYEQPQVVNPLIAAFLRANGQP